MWPFSFEQFCEDMTAPDLSEFEQDPDVSKILDLFSVQTIVNYVMSKVNTG